MTSVLVRSTGSEGENAERQAVCRTPGVLTARAQSLRPKAKRRWKDAEEGTEVAWLESQERQLGQADCALGWDWGEAAP